MTFSGKLLRINLSDTSYQVEEIPHSFYRDFISARGLSIRYLYDELPANVDPLGPQNKLIMSIGVLGGAGLQGFSKWAVVSKSPLTGTIFRSITGGNFGPWMKYAGYDLIIIEGISQKPAYIYIDADGIQFKDAHDLMGLDPSKTQRIIKERHGPRTESAVIGVAGERLVRYAVITSGDRTASRGGMGTVMGSKNLKAIAINTPIRRPEPFNKEKFNELVSRQIEILKKHPRKKNMTTLGTPYITTVVNKLGILPVKNFQEGSIEQIEEISGKRFLELKRKKAGCHLCMTRCGGMREVKEGPLKGSMIDGPEYESIFAFGPLLGISDRQFIIDANAMCDYFGLDTISTGVSISFACELYEKGILSSSDTEGLELSWRNKEAFLALIKKIAEREGIGYLLGEGVKRASRELGKDAPLYAMHIKGLELPGYDPRGVKGYALSMATSNIGGHHMYGRPRAELSGKVDPLKEKNKGADISKVQKEQALEDSLIACTFGNSGLDTGFYSEALFSATGIKEFQDPKELLTIGERILCVERCFNVREGFIRKDDTLPDRIKSEPLKNAGPCTGEFVRDIDGLLDEYYEELDYSKEGIPKKEKIKELRLSDLIKDIPKIKKEKKGGDCLLAREMKKD